LFSGFIQLFSQKVGLHFPHKNRRIDGIKRVEDK